MRAGWGTRNEPSVVLQLIWQGDECRAGLVACVKVKDLKVARSFHLITHRDRTRSPLAQAFVDFLESQPLGRPSQAT